MPTSSPPDPAAADATPDVRTARLGAGILLLAAVVFGALCLFQFQRDNAAPAVDLHGYPAAAADRYAVAVDRCERTAKKLTVQGWLAAPGQRREARHLRVVIAQGDTWRALETRLHDHDDVAGRAAAHTGVAGYYQHTGFSASADLATAGITGPIDALAIAHDSSAGRTLVSLPCTLTAP